MKSLSIAVVGVGSMGSNHVRVLSEMTQLRLIALCDINFADVEGLAKRYSVPSVCTDISHLLEMKDLDTVVIASPTVEHYSHVTQCLEHGLHVIVEKPMASTVEQCQEMMDIAKSNRLKLFVGHVERFNPVILKLKEFLDDSVLGDIYYVDTVRSGPFPKRLYGSKDGVTIDLAAHDFDLVSYFFGDIAQIYSHFITTRKNQQDIYAKVLYKTRQGIIGSSEFSWISPRKERSISIFGDRGMLLANLLDQEVWLYENGDNGMEYGNNYFQNVLWGRVSEGKVIKFPIKKAEPLKIELQYFRDQILKDEDHDPSYGLRAVECSLSLLESAKENHIVFLGKEAG